jgi:hypothetical protein
MLRGAAGAIVVATGLAATALGATAIRTARRTDSAQSKTPVKRVADSARGPIDSTARTPTSAAAGSLAATPPVVAKASAPAPTIPMGNSSLDGGITAERTDTAVTISFDMPMTRTRRPDKFEQLVRATLPNIYGSKIDSALTSIPSGGLAKQGDLLTELPSRGMRIPVDSAWEIRVFPETRKGVEGPLVVRYRASAVAR